MSFRPDPKPTPKPKKGKKPLKRTPLKKKYKATGMLALFFEIWEERPYVSELSGRSLKHFYGTDFFVNMFAHILAKGKGKYPKFALEKRNIMLLDPCEHDLIDSGTEEERKEYEKQYHCSFDKFYNKQKELLKEYKELYGTKS